MMSEEDKKKLYRLKNPGNCNKCGKEIHPDDNYIINTHVDKRYVFKQVFYHLKCSGAMVMELSHKQLHKKAHGILNKVADSLGVEDDEEWRV